jgi:bifunctional DNA-binding transcriptional regulator/antitoxin component of YhaV-PrlF toxin-antitoxin module
LFNRSLRSESVENAIKIKRCNVAPAGSRGFKVTLPKVWVDDLDIVNGTKLGAWSDGDNRLIVAVDDGVTVQGLVKIHNYRITRKSGSYTINLPKAWVENAKVKSGDCIDIYRDYSDRLILVKEAS